MSYTFKEQRDFFLDKDRFSVEVLSKEPPETNPHLKLVWDFHNKTNDNLRKYLAGGNTWFWSHEGLILPTQAYKENLADEVRIYLVIDKSVRKIVFYFGLCNGAVLDPPPRTESPHEDRIVQLIVKNSVYYLQKEKKELDPLRSEIGEKDFEKIYNIRNWKELQKLPEDLQKKCLELNKIRENNGKQCDAAEKSIRDAIRKVYDRKTCEHIFEVAGFLKAAYRDRNVTTKETEEQSRLVSKMYPAVLLTHFVKNDDYFEGNYGIPEKEMLFKMGDYVFWEVILEKLKEIRALSGLQYIYLLAAEGYIGGNPKEEEKNDLIASRDKQPLPEASLKLLAYYRRHFNFQFLPKVIDKQKYDFNCFSMLQTMDNLEQYKALNWDSNFEVLE